MARNTIESYLGNSSPLILLPARLKEYIQEIVEQCPDEISWIMEVKELADFYYEIEAVYIPRQKVHGATTEFDAEDILNLMQEEPDFKPENWRGWGHSHVNFPVEPSGQDRKMMLEFAKDCDFFVGMIHNKEGKMFAWIIDNTRKLFIRDVDVVVMSEYEEEVKSIIKKRVSKLVETPLYKNTSSTKKKDDDSGYGTFRCMGHDLRFVTKLFEGTTQSGYEIDGVFFPISKYPTPTVVVSAYEQAIKMMLGQGVDTYEDDVPSVNDMNILDEIEDYNRSKPTF